MTPKEKREYAEKLIANGDKRSYNEIKADLELQIWSDRFSSNINKQKKTPTQ
jgi:hypothetical protein